MKKKLQIFFCIILLLAYQVNCFLQGSQKRLLQQDPLVCINKPVLNIGYVGQGYNILLGNPRASNGPDPGFTNFSLIQYEYPSDMYDSYGQDIYIIKPKGATYDPSMTCSTRQVISMYPTLKEYTSKLQQQVKVTSNVNLPEFSLFSENYLKIRERMKNKQSFTVESQATCITGTAELLMGSDKPKLSDGFVTMLQALERSTNTTNAESAYHDFFNKVGTHVAVSVKLGSQFGYTMEFSNSVLKQVSVSNSLALSLVNKLISKSTRFSSEENILRDGILSWQTFQTGAHLPSDNDSQRWMNQTMTYPMPVYTNLISIEEFISRYINDNVGANLSLLASKMNQYRLTYCLSLKSKQGDPSICESKNEDAFQQPQPPLTLSEIKNSLSRKVVITEKSSGAALTQIMYQQNGGYYYSMFPRGFPCTQIGNDQCGKDRSEFTLNYIQSRNLWMIMKDNKCMFRATDRTVWQINYPLDAVPCNVNESNQLFKLDPVNENSNEFTISVNGAIVKVLDMSEIPPYNQRYILTSYRDQATFIITNPT